MVDLFLVERVGAVAIALVVGRLIGEILDDVPEIEPGGALDSPVGKRRADRLGFLEARNGMAAEAAEP